MAKKLSEYTKNNLLKLCLVGEPGAGKTTALASIARKKKLRVFDFDGKITSAANFYKDEPTVLENISVDNLQANMVSDPIESFNAIVDKELIPQQRKGEFEQDAVAVDSLTNFSQLVLKHIVKTNPGVKRVSSKQGIQPGMSDYGILRREFTRLIPGLLSLDMDIVMTAHISVTKDELTGEVLRKPVMDGSFSDILGVYFDEVWVLGVDKGRRIAQTQSNHRYKFCRSQIKGLPEKLDITEGIYKALEPYL